jgi:heme A synthase
MSAGSPPDRSPRFARYGWFVVAVNIAVVLWGALVRATGSGAGCGSHWPLCNGEVVPTAPELATVIEFTHRALSGVALLLVIGLWWGSRRAFPRRHPVRTWAAVSLALIVVEAMIGAGLVWMGWVAEDASLGRAISIPLHLGVTFSLLASLTMAAWRAARPAAPEAGPRNGPWLSAGLLGGMVLVGMTGALTALGDTLFPAESLRAGLEQDFGAGTNLMLRLRVIHPVLAVIVGVSVYLWAGTEREVVGSPAGRRTLLRALRGLVVVQLMAGAVNVILLAPVWLQLVHLLLADLVWIALVVSLADRAVARGAV